MRSSEYLNGRREGIKWAITWLHQRAQVMRDEHAKAILDTAAFNMGNDAKTQKIDTPETQTGLAETGMIWGTTAYGK